MAGGKPGSFNLPYVGQSFEPKQVGLHPKGYVRMTLRSCPSQRYHLKMEVKISSPALVANQGP